ncbi:hypothetical protein [Streptomyces sp. NPDC018045]|uniref:hypothetical protein n=1 Tax=Streptomyces sp. NPDC018045 TaxID=3365037 RepID=UPI003794EAEF
MKRKRPAFHPPWEQSGHFAAGDVVAVPPYGFGEEVLWAEGGFVRVRDMDGREEVRAAAHVRHAADCPPCCADFTRINDAAELVYETRRRHSEAPPWGNPVSS